LRTNIPTVSRTYLQVRQVEKNTARLDQIQAQILATEQTLRERAERRKGGRPIGADKVVKGKRRREIKRAVDLADEDDVEDATTLTSSTLPKTTVGMVKNANGAFVLNRTAVSTAVSSAGGSSKRARKRYDRLLACLAFD
jgi:hypothetical protein